LRRLRLRCRKSDSEEKTSGGNETSDFAHSHTQKLVNSLRISPSGASDLQHTGYYSDLRGKTGFQKENSGEEVSSQEVDREKDRGNEEIASKE
jgi:hypothetical protein